jgi:hypothetical protein
MARVLRVAMISMVSLLAFSAPAPEARAGDGSFRCGKRLVRDGDTEDDVSQKCGEPDASRTWTEVQTEGYWVGGRRLERSVPVTYTEWKYDFGRHRLMLYITFVQGRTVHVKTGEYGHR